MQLIVRDGQLSCWLANQTSDTIQKLSKYKLATMYAHGALETCKTTEE